MENQIQQFTHANGYALRTVEQDGNVYFVGKDAAIMLGYKDTVNALKQFCRGVVKRHPIVDSLGRTQEVRIISEPDFYRLVVNSKLPAAQEYERWVFEEVLPSIRRSGAYVASTGEESLEELMARALTAANEAIARQKARLEQQEAKLEQQELQLKIAEPKTIFADAVSHSDSCILVGELAKLIRQNGYEIGQNRLWKWMRENGYICKGSNNPTQRAMEQGLFRVIERAVADGNGFTRLCLTTKVTGKGQQHFINIFLRKTA